MLKSVLIALALAAAGQEGHAAAGAYADSVSLDGNTVVVAGAAAEHMKGEGLATILQQAASEAVFSPAGEQVGYRLYDLDPGSVFETLGLREGDVVLAVDEMPLTDPRRTVEILRYAKGLDSFSVLVSRQGIRRLMRVIVQ